MSLIERHYWRNYLASTEVRIVIADVVPIDVEAVVTVPVRVRHMAIQVAYCFISSISPEIFYKISCVPPTQIGILMRLYLNKKKQAVLFYRQIAISPFDEPIY